MYKYQIVVIESERDWEIRREVLVYDTPEEAQEAIDAINSENTSPTTPDWYMRADNEIKVISMTSSPRVHNRYHRDAPPGAVYIGRGSGTRGKWGNPFVIGDAAEGKDGTREEVIAKHRAWLLAQPDLMRHVRAELAGKSLVCFCKPAPCHGDTLLEVANCTDEEFAALITAAESG